MTSIYATKPLPPSDVQTKIYKNPNKDPKGRWRAVPMTAQGYRENQMYPITTPSGVVHRPPEGRCWSMVESEYKKLLEQGRIYFGKDGSAQPGVIRYLSELEGLVPWTWWPHDEVGHTDEARKQIQAIFGTQTAFETPKPVRLIQRIIQMATNPGDIVLDSCAGSGTTAQAVLALNAEGDGERRFILVQQKYDTKDDEKNHVNICQTVTAERIRRVITGVNAEPLGGSFTYARVSDRPLLGEYRTFGETLPSYEEIAKYIFYTETSHEFDPSGMDRETGKIGEYNGQSYYLLYTPNNEEDCALDLPFLESVGENDPNRRLVVYCEKIWLHRDDRLRWEDRTGKSVRPMLVPFQLK